MTDYAALEQRLRARKTEVRGPAGVFTTVLRLEPDALCAEAADAISALQKERDGRPTIAEWSDEIDRVRDYWKEKIASLKREALEVIDATLSAKIIYTGGGDEESIAECGMELVEPVRARLADLAARLSSAAASDPRQMRDEEVRGVGPADAAPEAGEKPAQDKRD